MNISVLTVFADLYKPFLQTSLVKRAIEKDLIAVDVDPFFSFVAPKERIDAPTYGHGPGMLIKPAVVERAIEAKEEKYGPAFKIFFSPGGKKLDQCLVQEIAQKVAERGHMMLLPARYEGMDARVEEHYADEIVSLGDFVLMGGDSAAMILMEAVLRCVPGVVGKAESVEDESFSGPFVEYPQYTEPVCWKDMCVPDVVRSGDHAAMNAWRMEESAKRTVSTHFDWLRSYPLTEQERALAREYIPAHYCALLHNDVLVGSANEPGNTSVTSIDIHDIARSAKTYGLKNYFIVTDLIDQQKIVARFLDFWMKEGVEYNRQRHEAVKNVIVLSKLDDVIARIKEIEGTPPVVIATSARDVDHIESITYSDQSKVWAHKRPVLFVFGTGRGITEERLYASDYLLNPIRSFTDYNHLSVRSAVAIIFDRWLGLQEKECK